MGEVGGERRPRLVTDRANPAERLGALLPLFWHPVATTDELDQAASGVLPVRLLGRDLAVADLGDGKVAAHTDRCPHRSTRLSVGFVEDGHLRCAYHGWKFDAQGTCVEIPSLEPSAPIPSAACVTSFRAVKQSGLVWVLLDARLEPPIPATPGFDDDSLRTLVPDPYTWPTSAPRRVENFVDLAHFAWVHDGSLGTRSEPVPPLPDMARAPGELQFTYEPPDLDPEAAAMFGSSDYRMPMPLTVCIGFAMAGGVRRELWMTASPIDDDRTRSFWMMSRSDDLDASQDAAHLAFQARVLAEDEPVVCNQVPAMMDLTPGGELSVRTDRVSIEYRRWLTELLTCVNADDRVDISRLRDRLGLGVAATTAAG